MKTVVFGKKVRKIYTVNDMMETITLRNGETKKVFVNKPFMRCKEEVDEWIEILRYKGAPRFNSCSFFGECFYISETEEVKVEKKVFRADLNEMHLFTNKIINETSNKNEAEKEIMSLYRQFNKTMIESNDRMLQYCNIHNLDITETDCFELFHLLFPNNDYKIENGKLYAVEISENKPF